MKFGKKKKVIETPTSHDNHIYKKPKKKGKAGDYRRWAKKYFKDGGREMLGIQPVMGMGIGRKRYCIECQSPPSSCTYKNNGCFCGKCGGDVKEYLPNDYEFLYHTLGNLPKWLWNVLDRYFLQKERNYKGHCK